MPILGRELLIGIVIGIALYWAVMHFAPGLIPGGRSAGAATGGSAVPFH